MRGSTGLSLALVLVACSGSGGASRDGGSGDGVASFMFVVNGVTLHPLSCPSTDWQFPWPAGEGDPRPSPPVPGVHDAYIVNTGTAPMAYLAEGLWTLGARYIPGVPTGGSIHQLTGVLAPGAKLDITSVYTGGTVAILGSSAPFSNPGTAKTVTDEGTIPWPSGVSGSGGATTMHIAEINVPVAPKSMCGPVVQAW